MKQVFFALYILLIFSVVSNGQTETSNTVLEESSIKFPDRYKVVGLNVTPLLTQLIPFNRSNPLTSGPYFMTYRVYNGRNAFRYGLGTNISNNSIDDNNVFLNLRLGWERRKSFYKRWSYSFGFDTFLSGGGFNLADNGNDDFLRVGVGFVWGMEYFINPKVSLNIETALYFGNTLFQFIPPVGLNLNFIIPKRSQKSSTDN